VLAQMLLFDVKFADLPLNEKLSNITVDVLPKKLDEEVAAGMVSGFGGVLTTMTDEQADYIGVSKVGPYKPELYRY
jgi:adenosylhomocysteinase